MYIYCFRKSAIELVWLLRKRFFLSIAQFTLGARIRGKIWGDWVVRNARFSLFYNNYLHRIILLILNRYFIIDNRWSGSITVFFYFNIFPFLKWDSLLCFNFPRSTSWFLDLASKSLYFPILFHAASNFSDFTTIAEKNTKLRCRKKYGIRCN